MNIQEIVTALTTERDRLSRAIDALSPLLPNKDKDKPAPKPVLRAKSTGTEGKRFPHPTPCKHGCGKEFKNSFWKESHEKDCQFVVRPNGSAPVARNPA